MALETPPVAQTSTELVLRALLFVYVYVYMYISVEKCHHFVRFNRRLNSKMGPRSRGGVDGRV